MAVLKAGSPPGSLQSPLSQRPDFKRPRTLSLLDAVGNQQVGIVPLIQQKHGPKVAHPLVCESGGGDQFQALHLWGRKEADEEGQCETTGEN